MIEDQIDQTIRLKTPRSPALGLQDLVSFEYVPPSSVSETWPSRLRFGYGLARV
jgi:hypothetical protein